MRYPIRFGIGVLFGLAGFAVSSVLASDGAPEKPGISLYDAVLPVHAESVNLIYAGGNRIRKPPAALSGAPSARLKSVAGLYGRHVITVGGVAVLEELPPEAAAGPDRLRAASEWLKANGGDPAVIEEYTRNSGELSRDLGLQLTPGQHGFASLTSQQRAIAQDVFQRAHSFRNVTLVQNVFRPDDGFPMPPGDHLKAPVR
ncbi:MAG TPA: hypothetical protein VGM37_01630 [Armatimonadota bacterium]|jgi:hypothetical protein